MRLLHAVGALVLGVLSLIGPGMVGASRADQFDCVPLSRAAFTARLQDIHFPLDNLLNSDGAAIMLANFFYDCSWTTTDDPSSIGSLIADFGSTTYLIDAHQFASQVEEEAFVAKWKGRQLPPAWRRHIRKTSGFRLVTIAISPRYFSL